MSIERVIVWNRTRSRAEALAATLNLPAEVEVADDLDAAVARADTISCATMTTSPILDGDSLRPGAHVDLIGAYRPDMREADDETLRRGRLFVDARETTIGEIGELMIPMASGALAETDVLADLRDLAAGAQGRRTDDEITVFKNGGGAHLDLMTAEFFLGRA